MRVPKPELSSGTITISAQNLYSLRLHLKAKVALHYLTQLDEYSIDPPLRYRIYRNYKQRYIAIDNERLRIFVSGTTELEAFSEFKEWLRALITGYMLENDDKLSSCGKELKNKLAARFKKCTGIM